MAELMLDTKGLSCPLPILKARKTLRTMSAGQTLEVLSNDPASPDRFHEFCASDGHELLECINLEGNTYRIIIKRGAD